MLIQRQQKQPTASEDRFPTPSERTARQEHRPQHPVNFQRLAVADEGPTNASIPFDQKHVCGLHAPSTFQLVSMAPWL